MIFNFSGRTSVSGNVRFKKPGPATLFSAIQSEGLTSGLQLALDAGDINSYSGSGQKWLDTSGNGYDFYRGATSSPDADDPTFNGVAGAITSDEYWSFDGNDFFQLDQSNPTWVNNLHKNNAQWSLLAAVYLAPSGSLHGLMGTNGGSAAASGLYWLINSTNKQSTYVSQPGSPPSVNSKSTDDGLTDSAWHIIGWTMDEAAGAGGGFFYEDGNYDQDAGADTIDATYLNPTSNNATNTLQIGKLGQSGGSPSPMPSGDRIAFFAAWEGTVLTKANYDGIYARLQGRFGI